MYRDRRRSAVPIIVVLAVIIIAVAAAIAASGGTDRDIAEESAASLKAAVERGALQCYAVEGVYPPDLQYLEEHYGVQVNHEDFYVTYDIFASNVPPEILVTPRVH